MYFPTTRVLTVLKLREVLLRLSEEIAKMAERSSEDPLK